MTDRSGIPQDMRALAQARGLERAYMLSPEAFAAAVARGTTCLSALPANVTPATEPALTFDPARFADLP
jgi:hypothetical protein